MIAHHPQILLRAATPDDAAALASLLAAVLAPGEDPVTAAAGELAAVERSETRRLSLLESEGEPVGALGWWADHPAPGTALLGLLVVHPRERRRGFGARALEMVLAELRRDGILSVRTAVPVGDFATHAFLRAHGFTEMSIRDHVAMGQAGLNLLLFAREVG